MSRFVPVRLGAALVVLTACLTGVNAAAAPSVAADLPTPYEFVSELDLECFETDPYRPDFPGPLLVQHLNPVLQDLPRDILEIGEREQLCTPVAKNDKYPPDHVLQFVAYVDLACYRVHGHAVDFRLTLMHLNPQLADGRLYDTAMYEPEHLCLPVVKNDKYPPEHVLRLISYLDLLCYREEPTVLDRELLLTQLNPELREVRPVNVGVREGVQLCVPIRKEDQQIPDDVLQILQWVDLEKYVITPHEIGFELALELRHLNPLYADLPAERAHLRLGTHLMLPVAKNRAIPPRG
ncbi:MAG TPA: hypothetical protein VGD67_09065 [Pseudonocardiaceae bacterium]